MYVETQTRRKNPFHLLCESVRTPKGPRRRVLTNLSGWPERRVQALKAVLRGGVVISDSEWIEIHDQRSHGAVAAALEVARATGLVGAIAPRRSKVRGRVLAMVIWRLLHQGSKRSVMTELGDSGTSTLGALLGVGGSTLDELYEAMDWLLANQPHIERRLADAHLCERPCTVLYDVSSSYFEGDECMLAALGYSRDDSKRPQVVYGLLCSKEGCPVSVEAFPGNTPDVKTLRSQVEKVHQRFGIKQVILVGDRGMVCRVSIEKDLRPSGMKWVSALRSVSIAKLVRQGAIQTDLFTEHGLASVTSPDYPDERLLVCYNPTVAAKRAAARESMLARTEKRLEEYAERYAAEAITRDQLNERIGETRRLKMLKHIDYGYDDEGRFHMRRNEEGIRDEGKLDGFYIIRTNVSEEDLDDTKAVEAYKSLARVERAFRCMKDTLEVRPIYHRLADRVRAHLLLCMLAYHIEYHMRRALASLLFAEERPECNANPVAPAKRSGHAKRKDRRKKNEEGLALRSFPDLLTMLEGISVGKYYPLGRDGGIEIPTATAPGPVPAKVFELLQIKPLAKSKLRAVTGAQ